MRERVALEGGREGKREFKVSERARRERDEERRTSCSHPLCLLQPWKKKGKEGRKKVSSNEGKEVVDDGGGFEAYHCEKKTREETRKAGVSTVDM